MMGMGEPLDNLDEVLKVTGGDDIIPMDTVGVRSGLHSLLSGFKGLQRFIEESDCHLAVSLHSPVPQQRRELMPAEKAFSITEIVDLLRNYDFSKQRRLSFEYIVLKE